MRRLKLSATLPIAALALALTAGCQGMGGRRSVAVNEPPMDDSLVARDGDVVGDGLVARVTPPPPAGIAFVDRHPLFSPHETSTRGPARTRPSRSAPPRSSASPPASSAS